MMMMIMVMVTEMVTWQAASSTSATHNFANHAWTNAHPCPSCHTGVHARGTVSRAALDAALSVWRNGSTIRDGSRDYRTVDDWAPGRKGTWRAAVAQAAVSSAQTTANAAASEQTAANALTTVSSRTVLQCGQQQQPCNVEVIAGRLYHNVVTDSPAGSSRVEGGALLIGASFFVS